MNRFTFLFAVFLASCGTSPPLNSIAEPPIPPAVQLQENISYGPLDMFKTGETVLSTTDAKLKSLGDVAGLRSTPVGMYDLIIRAYADTVKAIQPRMFVKLGSISLTTVRVRNVVNDYVFQNVTGTGDTLRIILGDDYYDPITKDDVNIHIFSVTFSFTGSTAPARLVWDANTEPDLAGYNVYYGLSSRVYGSPIGVGLIRDYPLLFNDGKTRYFSVTAYDTARNESGYSNEISWTAPTPPDTTPKPKPDSTLINWPDNKQIKMRIVYQQKDATGKAILTMIRLQMEKFDSLSANGWYDRFDGVDYDFTNITDSTAIIALRMELLKAGMPQAGGKYTANIRFRIRLENKADATKVTPWVYGDKAIHLYVAPNPLEGVPLLPTFKIILE